MCVCVPAKCSLDTYYTHLTLKKNFGPMRCGDAYKYMRRYQADCPGAQRTMA